MTKSKPLTMHILEQDLERLEPGMRVTFADINLGTKMRKTFELKEVGASKSCIDKKTVFCMRTQTEADQAEREAAKGGDANAAD